MQIKIMALALGAAAALASCSGDKGWSVSGTIDGAQGGKLALEGFNNGIWYVVDSLDLSGNGKFSYAAEQPVAYPEIFRLTSPGRDGAIYFPVNTDDKVKIKAYADHFSTGYSMTGSPQAETVCRVDSLVAASVNAEGAVNAAEDSELARKLVGYLTSDTTGIVAYYVVGKTVAGKPLFDPDTNFGNRVYGAAAQVFIQYRPDDVRGELLKARFFQGRQALGLLSEGTPKIVEVPETGVIEIERYDNKGVRHSLRELAETGKVILLSFTAYGMDNALAYNVILNDIYTKNHDNGLEIYQIAFDEDELQWKNVAVNLPWITVWNSASDGITPLANYNVGSLPMTFIIDRKGTIAERVPDPTQLASKVSKYM